VFPALSSYYIRLGFRVYLSIYYCCSRNLGFIGCSTI